MRTALIDLLTTGQHHDAATTATLRAVGATRSALVELHQRSRHNPVAYHAQADDRHAALISSALGDIARTLLADRRHDYSTELRAGLTTLAAVALAWLDALPHPTPDDGDDTDYHDGAEPEPF